MFPCASRLCGGQQQGRQGQQQREQQGQRRSGHGRLGRETGQVQTWVHRWAEYKQEYESSAVVGCGGCPDAWVIRAMQGRQPGCSTMTHASNPVLNRKPPA